MNVGNWTQTLWKVTASPLLGELQAVARGNGRSLFFCSYEHSINSRKRIPRGNARMATNMHRIDKRCGQSKGDFPCSRPDFNLISKKRPTHHKQTVNVEPQGKATADSKDLTSRVYSSLGLKKQEVPVLQIRFKNMFFVPGAFHHDHLLESLQIF